jgi:hypothetical protein
MKIKAQILTKAREVKVLKINPSDPAFMWKKGVYLIEAQAINRWSSDNPDSGGVEIFYLEGNPSPIFIKPQLDKDKNEIDPSSRYLDEMLVSNVLEETGEVKEPRFSWIRERFPTTAGGGFVLFFFIMVILSIVIGLLRGGSLF